MKQIIAALIFISLLLLFVNNPSIFADMFMVIFNFVSVLVQSIQDFAVDVFNRITS